MNTIPCPNCQRPIRSAAKFCGHCGATLPANLAGAQPPAQQAPVYQPPSQTPQPPPAQAQDARPQPKKRPAPPKKRPSKEAAVNVTCPDGHINRPGVKFCATCGKPMPTIPPPPPVRKPRWGLFVLIGVVMVALIVWGVLSFWPGLTGGSAEQTTPTIESTIVLPTTAEAPQASATPAPATPTPDEQSTGTAAAMATDTALQIKATADAQTSATVAAQATAAAAEQAAATQVAVDAAQTAAAEQSAYFIDEKFDGSSNLNYIGSQPQVNPEEKEMVLTGESLEEDRVTYAQAFPAAGGEIRFRIEVDKGALGFRLDEASNGEMIPFEFAPFSMEFTEDKIVVCNDGNPFSFPRPDPQEDDVVVITISRDYLVTWRINDDDFVVNNQPLSLKAEQVSVSFAGSGKLSEFKVKLSQ